MKRDDKRKIVLVGTGMVGMSYAYALLQLADETPAVQGFFLLLQQFVFLSQFLFTIRCLI